MKRVKIAVHVPSTHADIVRQALGDAGAGNIGEYSYCSFTLTGIGRSMPSTEAKPYIGTAGSIELIEEEHVEVVCDRSKARAAIDAMKNVHPYQEVGFTVTPILEIEDL